MEYFLTEPLASIIFLAVVLAIAAILFFVAKGKNRKIAKQILLSLVVAAEKQFGGGTGDIKFSYVWEKLYERMPFVVRLLFTADEIADMIEEAVSYMKERLSEDEETTAEDS